MQSVRMYRAREGHPGQRVVSSRQVVTKENPMHLLARHRAEALRRLRNHKYDIGAEELLIPAMGLKFHGHFEVAAGNEPFEGCENIVVNEGLLDILGVYFAQGSQHAAFYTSLFTGNITPGATLTAATYHGTATESTAYEESTRVLWEKDAAASNAIGNDTTPAVFTTSAGGPYTFRGAGLHNIATRQSGTGVLVAAARFATDKVMGEAEELRVKYIFTGSSS
jgi:hypothetical protein